MVVVEEIKMRILVTLIELDNQGGIPALQFTVERRSLVLIHLETPQDFKEVSSV